MDRLRRQVQVIVLAAAMLLNGCVVVAPAAKVLIVAAVLIGTYAYQTAVYQTVELTLDEVVRPLLRKMMGKRFKDLVEHPDDPLRAELYGTFEIKVQGRENEPPHVVGRVSLVRATPDSEWKYDPLFIARMEKQLGGNIAIRQR